MLSPDPRTFLAYPRQKLFEEALLYVPSTATAPAITPDREMNALKLLRLQLGRLASWINKIGNIGRSWPQNKIVVNQDKICADTKHPRSTSTKTRRKAFEGNRRVPEARSRSRSGSEAEELKIRMKDSDTSSELDRQNTRIMFYKKQLIRNI